MSEASRGVKIRVKSGENEAEIEASMSNIHEAIELIPQILAKFPQGGPERRLPGVGPAAEAGSPRAHERQSSSAATFVSPPSSFPIVTVEKGDSLSDVISKFFADSWGSNPRKLMEVREALQSYGLNYPKQSVAVALLRLAKGSRIRRFKGEGGEYVYTVSTGAVRISAPAHPTGAAPIPVAEASPAPEGGHEEEEQLNLDAPTAH